MLQSLLAVRLILFVGDFHVLLQSYVTRGNWHT